GNKGFARAGRKYSVGDFRYICSLVLWSRFSAENPRPRKAPDPLAVILPNRMLNIKKYNPMKL
ncbi:hypothetical protein, partial [Myroides odoratimimus]|uniref:hypothetical protein n=1 Tax=Myroides odoratimimus TaxID=76832 RepID=UPI00257644F1